jgi:cell division protein FtsL
MKKELYFIVLLFLAIIFLSLTLYAIVAIINLDFIEENLFWIVLTAMVFVASGVMGYAFTKKLMDLIEEDKQITKFKKDNEKWPQKRQENENVHIITKE